MKILVAYASRHGSTRGIAERIAATLERHELRVALRPVSEAGDPGSYDAFVVGSAAYMGGWMGEATTFVRRNRDALAVKPTWLFSSGPIGTETVDSKGRDTLRVSEPKEFAEFAASLQPRGTRVFFGAFDPTAPAVGVAEKAMATVVRFVPAARDAMPAGDFRDWPTIEAWAEEIAEWLLREATPVPVSG